MENDRKASSQKPGRPAKGFAADPVERSNESYERPLAAQHCINTEKGRTHLHGGRVCQKYAPSWHGNRIFRLCLFGGIGGW